MRRFVIAVALACAISSTAFAGDIHTAGAPAPGEISTSGAPAPADIPTVGNPTPGEMPVGGFVLAILDLLF